MSEQTKTAAIEPSPLLKKSVGVILATYAETTPFKLAFLKGKHDPVAAEEVLDDNGDPIALPRPLQRFDDKPLVEYALDLALAAPFEKLFVIANVNEQVTAGVQAAIDAAMAQAAPDTPRPSVLAYDPALDAKATRAAHNFSFMGFTKGLLDLMTEALRAAPAADSVVIMPSDQPILTMEHLNDEAIAFDEAGRGAGIDAVSAWLTVARREPSIIARELLEGLEDSPYVNIPEGVSDRPVPRFHIDEVPYTEGIDQCSVVAPAPSAVEAFFSKAKLSALEAVVLARGCKTDEDFEDLKLKAADARLVSLARDILARADKAAASDEEDLTWANTWAKRNRLDFPIFKQHEHEKSLVYLDAAATTQRPSAMLEAQMRYDITGNANIDRCAYPLSRTSSAQYTAARKKIQAFIGGDEGCLVFAQNTSGAVNVAVQAWGECHIEAGDLLVFTKSEHHSAYLPWVKLAERKGALVDTIPVGTDGRIDQDAYAALLARKPKLVVVAHASNTLGLLNPVKQMAEQAHEAGALFFVDAAQTAGHMRINADELGADFIAFSAHKMYGPLGIGGLWVTSDIMAAMKPYTVGGGCVTYVGNVKGEIACSTWQSPKGYEYGTPPISQAVAWAAGVEYLETLGMDNLERHQRILTKYLVDGLHEIDDVTVWGDRTRDDGLNGLVSFEIAGIEPMLIGGCAGRLGVAIRSNPHCAIPFAESMGLTGSARASISVHTTRDDIDALLIAVEMTRQLYGLDARD